MALAVKAIATLYGEEDREFRGRAVEAVPLAPEASAEERRYMERPQSDLNNAPSVLAVREILCRVGRYLNSNITALSLS